jgi:uncharacterized protein with PIN domain
VTQLLDRLNKPPKKNPNEIYSDEEDDMIVESLKYPYYFITSEVYEDQLREVTNHFKIMFQQEIFLTRCLKCNSLKSTIQMENLTTEWKEKLGKFIGEKAYKEFNDHITFCPICKRVFWDGWYYPKCLKFAKKYSYRDIESLDSKEEFVEEDLTELSQNLEKL